MGSGATKFAFHSDNAVDEDQSVVLKSIVCDKLSLYINIAI